MNYLFLLSVVFHLEEERVYIKLLDYAQVWFLEHYIPSLRM